MQNQQTLATVTHTHTHTHTLCLQDYSLKTVANFACKKIYIETMIGIKLMHIKTVH